MKKWVFVILLCFMAALTGCGKGELIGLSLETETQIFVTDSAYELSVAPTFTKENISEEDALALLDGAGLVWDSQDKDVASVEGGLLTAHQPGTTTISVEMPDSEIGDSIEITVVRPLEKATVTESIELTVDESFDLEVALRPADASDVEISYISSEPDFLTVEDNGRLSPMTAGEATVEIKITAYDTAGARETITLSTRIIILPKAAEIGLDEYEGSLFVGETLLLEPFVIPQDAAESSYMFTSSDETVATVDKDGLITALAAGFSTISITDEEGLETEYRLTVMATGVGNQIKSETGASGNSSQGGGSGSGSGSGGQGNNANGSDAGNKDDVTTGGNGSGNGSGGNGQPNPGYEPPPPKDPNEGLSPEDDDYIHDGGLGNGYDDGQSTEGVDGDAW